MASVMEAVSMVSAVAGNSACVASVVIMVRSRKAVEHLEQELEDEHKQHPKG